MPTPKKAASPKNALSKPVQPDAALAAVVGKDPLPRTELTKKLWEYIRKHELQDPKEKRNIRADERLLAVFDGKKVVSMFEMTKLVNGHLILESDRSQSIHAIFSSQYPFRESETREEHCVRGISPL
jgi:upstream activation factor subunit UAF30